MKTEPLTAEWLESVGFQKECDYICGSLGYFQLGDCRWSIERINGRFCFADSTGVCLGFINTRQDVRDLCRVLGVPIGGG